MREIKFRAWRGEMLDWSKLDDSGLIEEIFSFHNPGYDSAGNYYDIMQFTGLHDKNGTEIYEGDIVRGDFRSPVGAVKFYTEDIGSCGCCYEEFRGSGFAAYGGNAAIRLGGDECEVIGNIHENPELLTR